MFQVTLLCSCIREISASMHKTHLVNMLRPELHPWEHAWLYKKHAPLHPCNRDISASLHVIREGLGRFCV